MAGGHKQKRLSNSCILLIVIAGIERFAFKGVASNLVTYLTDVVNLSNSSAAKMVNSWVGFTSIMPLLVAPIADAYWEKYSTIMSSSFLYVMGLAALTTTALARSWHHKNRTMSSSFLSLSLYLISLGQGGYNPSLQAFGADQLGEEEDLPCGTDDTSSNKKALFFQWWYFGVCAGSLMGVTFMSYIQDTFGWVLGFAIPAISMLLSILIFSSGSSIYSYKKQDDDDGLQDKKPFMNMFQTIKASALKCFHCEITLPNDKSEGVELELQETPLCRENSESIKVMDKDSKISMCLLPNVKVVIKLLPIWAMLLMFAVIFQQPATFFTKQGMTMKRNIGKNFKIPPATLQSAITLSIILLMPLYDKVFIPFAQLITRQEKGINKMQRMGIGMVLSIIAMVIAALVEMKRLDIGRQMRSEGSKLEIVPISIFWLLPQYILLGVSDIFTVVGMQEFFYGEVPKNMRTVGIALYTSVFGVGSFVSALLITLVEQTLPNTTATANNITVTEKFVTVTEQLASVPNLPPPPPPLVNNERVLENGIIKRAFNPYGSVAYNFVTMGAYRGGVNTFAIIGIASKPLHLYSKPTYECEWISAGSGGGDSRKITTVAYKMLPDWGYGRVYTVVIINCTFSEPLNTDNTGGKLILYASTSGGGDTSLNITDRIEVLNEPNGTVDFSIFTSKPKYDYFYCGSSLYGNLNPQRVREWIAYHVKFFGPSSHFVIHDAGGVHAEVYEVLKPWIELGYVTLQDIRDQERFDGYYHNQFMVVNDCLHRYKFMGKWMFFFDVDEYIYVPPKSTIKSVLNSLSEYSQFTIEQMPMNNQLCHSSDYGKTYRKWGIEKLVYKDVKKGIRRDRKYAVQPRRLFATGVHMSQNLDGKTTHNTEGRIKYFHYHGTIAQRRESCKVFLNSTETTYDKTPYGLDTTLRDIAGVIKKFELKMIGNRVQKTKL